MASKRNFSDSLRMLADVAILVRMRLITVESPVIGSICLSLPPLAFSKLVDEMSTECKSSFNANNGQRLVMCLSRSTICIVEHNENCQWPFNSF